MLKLINMKYLIPVLSIFYTVNINSQIDNIAERLGYNKDAKLLIIHADDIGIAHSVNIASFDAYKNNGINSGSVMMISPWVKEVAEFHDEYPNYDIGVHLTLNSRGKKIINGVVFHLLMKFNLFSMMIMNFTITQVMLI